MGRQNDRMLPRTLTIQHPEMFFPRITQLLVSV
jgi:hypothetical protein